ncbi:MAG TPA: biotin/lipoyl-binding protein, partial [Hyphomicrobiaceae bacterium]|nr:biotin/lipoyl-binding protein [Hyphomicrobiaceae bacterium]
MKTKTIMAVAAGALVAAGGWAAWTGKLALLKKPAPAPEAATPAAGDKLAAAVSVVKVERGDFVDQVLVTGTLVAREEILVGPEVEGLRIVAVLAEEGQRVKQGDVLARLVTDTLDAQLAQNAAALAKATAGIAQARSNIVAAEARQTEAKNALERGRPLRQSGVISEASQDSREAAAKTAEAQLVAARDALKVAEADKAQVEAVRRDLEWRRSRADVRAPADGVISRRVAKLG